MSQANYTQMSDTDFDTILEEIVGEMSAAQILAIGDVNMILREEFNNEVLTRWEGKTIPCTFVSVWAEGEVSTKAKVNLKTGEVTDVEVADCPDNYQHLESQRIEIDGYRFDIDQERWEEDNDELYVHPTDLAVINLGN